MPWTPTYRIIRVVQVDNIMDLLEAYARVIARQEQRKEKG